MPTTDPPKVGYGSPPLETRFKPGSSGNPRGRAKGLRPIAAQIRDALQQKIPVTRNGRQTLLPLQEVMFNTIALKAAKGDLRAASLLISLQDRYQDSPVTTIEPGDLNDGEQSIMAEFIRRLSGPSGGPADTEPGS